jgi:hypothetical protein
MVHCDEPVFWPTPHGYEMHVVRNQPPVEPTFPVFPLPIKPGEFVSSQLARAPVSTKIVLSPADQERMRALLERQWEMNNCQQLELMMMKDPETGLIQTATAPSMLDVAPLHRQLQHQLQARQRRPLQQDHQEGQAQDGHIIVHSHLHNRPPLATPQIQPRAQPFLTPRWSGTQQPLQPQTQNKLEPQPPPRDRPAFMNAAGQGTARARTRVRPTPRLQEL